MLLYYYDGGGDLALHRPYPVIRSPNTFHGSRIIKAGTGPESFIRQPTAQVPTSRSECAKKD